MIFTVVIVVASVIGASVAAPIAKEGRQRYLLHSTSPLQELIFDDDDSELALSNMKKRDLLPLLIRNQGPLEFHYETTEA